MKQQANSLAEVDKLNIIFFGEMDISSAEKSLRVVMAAALSKPLLRFYDAIQRFSKEIAGAVILAAAAAEFEKSYLEFFAKYYAEYMRVLGVVSAENPDRWAREHARELAKWIVSNGRQLPFSERLLNTVRTEVNEIGNLALLNAALGSKKTKKRWKTFGDSKVRPTHKDAAGQTVPIGEPFTVGGYKLMFPCDSSLGAGAEEIVNCRCTVQYL